MKQLLKENIVLVAGICLPLVLASIFWMSKEVRLVGIAPPRMEVVFVANNNDGLQNPWEIDVRDGTLHVAYSGISDDEKQRHWQPPQIFVFNPVNNISRRVELPKIEKEDIGKSREFVPDLLSDTKLNTDDISPEGYTFIRNDGSYNRGLITEVFSGRRDRSQFILQNGNYRMQVPQSGYNAKFIGWVMQ